MTGLPTQAALVAAMAVTVAAGTGCDRTSPPDGRGSSAAGSPVHLLSDSLVATPIPVSLDLRLNRSFDYSEFYGVLRSQRELNALWQQLVTVDDASDLGVPFLGGDVPDPPTVDFMTNSVIWFAHAGAKASFVTSLELQRVSPDTLRVIVNAFHSDFGSRGLNLWAMPRFDGPVTFEVRHEYDERSP